MDRRDFLKIVGISTATGAASLCGCKSKNESGVAGGELGPIPTDKMTYRTNPKQGDKVSLLGYGWMRLPNKKDNNGQDVIDQEQVNRLCKFALDHGVNYFDTSPAYCRGKSEESLGIALEASGYKRSDYFIATKLSNFSPTQYSLEEGKAMFERSLQYLKTDYVDYLLLHSIGGGGMGPVHQRYLDNGLLDWLIEQREAGRIRNLGFSFHGNVAVFDWALANQDKYHWDFVQIQANYVEWEHEDNGRSGKYLYEELAKRNIPVVIMEPLLGGRLSKVPDHVVSLFKQRKPENSVASWAFRYIGSKPQVLTVLSGMTYMEHLEDNVRTYSPLEPLTEEEQQWLEGKTATLIKSYPTIDCNDCKYCMPCPYGIDIPAILLHYNKCVNEGEIATSIQDENYRKARRAYLVSYDRAVPKLRQAARCIGCNQCMSHCPQSINIPRELHKIDRYIENLRKDTL